MITYIPTDKDFETALEPWRKKHILLAISGGPAGRKTMIADIPADVLRSWDGSDEHALAPQASLNPLKGSHMVP